MRYERVLITGGSGRLGPYVVERLAGRCELTVLDRVAPQDARVRYADTSITDYEGLKACFRRIDAIVHLAAIPNPRTSTPETCFHVNTQGTWSVLQAAEDAGVRRVVVASSDAATGLHYNPPDWFPQFLPVDETHPLRPSEVYSLTKEITEAIARCFAARGRLEVLALRPAHIVFPAEYPEIEARGADVDNYHYWGYVAPEDVAQAVDLALGKADGRYDACFIAAKDGLNTVPTLEMLKQRLGYLPEIRRPRHYEDNPTAGVFDITHAMQALGYEPQVHWRDFLERSR